MKELLEARAMESMCRQRASFFPMESWKYLAEAEMWNHRALDLIDGHHFDCNQFSFNEGEVRKHSLPN